MRKVKELTYKERARRYTIINVILAVIIFTLCVFFYVAKNNLIKHKNKNVEASVTTTATPTPRPTPIITVKERYKRGKLLQEHTVYHYSDYNRDINLDKAAKAINGTKLDVGEEFEFYNAIGGEPTEEKGYVKAGSIMNGNNVDTVGGGICEVATSLNTAIIDAGIPTNADTHSKEVGYLNETDHEATVAFGQHTLKFINTLKHQILIKMKAIRGNVRTRIFKMNKIYVVTIKDPITGKETVKKYSEKKMPKKYKQFIPEY